MSEYIPNTNGPGPQADKEMVAWDQLGVAYLKSVEDDPNHDTFTHIMQKQMQKAREALHACFKSEDRLLVPVPSPKDMPPGITDPAAIPTDEETDPAILVEDNVTVEILLAEGFERALLTSLPLNAHWDSYRAMRSRYGWTDPGPNRP